MITWQLLTINSNQNISEQLSIWLNLLNAQSIEHSANGHTTKALFLPNIPAEQVTHFLEKNIDATLSFTIEAVFNNAWHKTQNNDLQPIEIGPHLAIYPDSYKGNTQHDTSLFIRAIDAFGTGEHPTTFQCLQWLSQQNLQDKEIVDFGCGSGILAIAALALGAKHVYAIDIDPKALDATKKNAALNNIHSDQLTLDRELSCTSEIIIANLFVNPLCELKNHFSHHLTFDGKILLAGILSEQSEQLLRCYKHDFSICQISEIAGWPLYIANNKT